MSDLIIPLNLQYARASFHYIENTGKSRGMFGGPLRTASFGGDRLGATLEFTPHGGKSDKGRMERAQLKSFLARLRGAQNRAYLYDQSYRRRGSFPTGELIANNTFSNGTTGWTTYNSDSSIAVYDRTLRALLAKGGGENWVSTASAVAIAQYAPYVLRAMVLGGRQSGSEPTYQASVSSGLGTGVFFSGSDSVGMVIASGVAGNATAVYAAISKAVGNNAIPGDYFQVPYLSLSRCALIDNGPNFIAKSDQFDDAYWTATGATITANNSTAPDGTVTGDDLVETAVTSGHFVNSTSFVVSSAAEDISFSVCLKKLNRSWAVLQIQENAAPSSCLAYFDLQNGVVGTTTAGTNWSNIRTFVTDMGNGWYRCTIVARKTSASTVLVAYVNAASANGVSSYLGVASAAITMWRATLCISSVPTRLIQTTTTTSGSAQSGSALHIKGLPASTAGLLLEGDQVEIVTPLGSELKLVTAALNSDAAGLGYLQFEPPLRNSPADSAPIILHQPMGKFVFSGDLIGWDEEPGMIVRASAEFEEAD